MKYNLLVLTMSLFSVQSYGFDLEDYATTYRATRDAYFKAQNEIRLAKDPMDEMNAMLHRLEDACYRPNWGTADRFVNFDGIMTGACNADGALPHRTGGPKLTDGTQKFGDQMATLVELSPVTSLFPTFSTENAAGNYRARRDAVMKASNEAFLSKYQSPMILETIPNCKVKDQSLRDYITANWSGWNDDFFTTYRAVRDAFLKAANEVQLATSPYVAAQKAYEAAVTVYNMVNDCETNLGRESIQYYDPYDWQ